MTAPRVCEEIRHALRAIHLLNLAAEAALVTPGLDFPKTEEEIKAARAIKSAREYARLKGFI